MQATDDQAIMTHTDKTADGMSNIKLNYRLEDKPPFLTTCLLGFQNIVTAFGGIVAVPFVLSGFAGLNVHETSYLISAALLCSGIVSIIQSRGIFKKPFRVGTGMPTVMGTDFGFVPPAYTIINTMGGGMAGYFGASMLGALLEIFLSYFVKPLMKFFPQVVTGTVITLIGVTIMPVAFDWVGGGVGSPNYGAPINIMLATFVFLVAILLNRYGKGIISNASILIGIVVGYLISIPLDLVDFSQVAAAEWFAMPQVFRYGVDFNPKFVIPFIAGYLVTVIETVGVVQSIGNMTQSEMTDEIIADGVRADGFGSLISPILGSGPVATFSQNAGLIPLTKCASRSVAIAAGVMLVILSLFPKLATVVSIMPPPVLGGVGVLMFGTVASAGVQSLSEVKFNNRNMLIIASAIGIGLGVTMRPELISSLPETIESWPAMVKGLPGIVKALFSSGISAGTIVAFILNILLKEEE
ncbi:MAG: purine permease [Synergistaceae bacterium]|nr:purine permease [Synergistaceae bacterium]